MIGRRSFGWTYNQAAKTKAAKALERSRLEATAAAATEMSGHVAEPLNELSRAHEVSHNFIFFETEAKDLPHPLNKRRIEFRVFTSALAKRHGITLVQLSKKHEFLLCRNLSSYT